MPCAGVLYKTLNLVTSNCRFVVNLGFETLSLQSQSWLLKENSNVPFRPSSSLETNDGRNHVTLIVDKENHCYK